MKKNNEKSINKTIKEKMTVNGLKVSDAYTTRSTERESNVSWNAESQSMTSWFNREPPYIFKIASPVGQRGSTTRRTIDLFDLAVICKVQKQPTHYKDMACDICFPNPYLVMPISSVVYGRISQDRISHSHNFCCSLFSRVEACFLNCTPLHDPTAISQLAYI